MTTIKLPPLPSTPWCGLVHEGRPYEPEWTSNQDGFTEEDMWSYAEAAVKLYIESQASEHAMG